MDPVTLTDAEWRELGALLTHLWGVVALIVFFAANVLMGHVWIPSFVESGHLPERVGKSRPLFYLVAVASFGGAVFLLARVVDFAGVLRVIYERLSWV